jgi:putative ABC transport system permease protein
MEIPLVKGRLLTGADRLKTPPVALINESMAARFFADVDPIGRRLRRGGSNSSQPWITIVGVVADVRHLGVDRQPVPELFLPHAQVPWPGLTMMVRTNSDPLLLTNPLRDLVRELGPLYELRTPRTMEQFVSSSVGTRRLAAQLLSLFGALATVIAAIGIYTVVTFGVVQRTQELGIRIALGATMANLGTMVLAQSAPPILIGIALGWEPHLFLPAYWEPYSTK